VKISAFRLPLQPLAVAEPIFALDPLDLAGCNAARPQGRLSDDDCAFEQLALGQGQV
jgi:hypothetical protein